jgi:hypothetical protein
MMSCIVREVGNLAGSRPSQGAFYLHALTKAYPK